MRSANKVHILRVSLCHLDKKGIAYMSGQEGIDDALAITERYTSLVVLPINCRIRRVGPYEIVEETVIRYIRRSLDTPNIVH